MAQNWQLPLVGTDLLSTALKTKVSQAAESLRTSHSGATQPSSMVPYMLWADTSTGYLKLRNSANTDWVTIAHMASPTPFPAQGTIVASLSATATIKLGVAPRSGTCSKLILVTDTASTSSSGNEWRFALQKRTNALPGTPVALFSANVGTFTALSGVGGGAETIAHAAYVLVPNQNAAITELDELELVATKVGTGTTLVNFLATAWVI
jgi:hypothetical protein